MRQKKGKKENSTMIIYRAALTTAILCVMSNAVSGQTPDKPGSISGQVIDGQKRPVVYATVVLLKTDSSVAGGGLTDDEGKFVVGNVDTGRFLLRVTGLGFSAQFVSGIIITRNDQEKELAPIVIMPGATAMKEVQVTGERRMMELAVDKKVFNVEKNTTSAGGNAADVLQNVPSVSVEADGGVSLRGKSNVAILIDGKPATLLGGDVASALRSLPAASIERVEVITNPSAKYDAQGVGGIINIITKKTRSFGQNGSVTAGAGSGTQDKYNVGVNLNAKNDKWNIFLSSNYNANRNYSRVTTDRRDSGGARYYTFEDNVPVFAGWFTTVGATYSMDKKNTIGVSQNLNYMHWREQGVTSYKVFGNDGHLSSIDRRRFDQEGSPLGASTSLDYKHQFAKEGQELTSGITFAQMWNYFTETYHTSRFDSNDVQLPYYKLQVSPGRGDNGSLNMQADVTTPIAGKNGKLEAGWKSQLFWFYSGNNPTVDTANAPVVDTLLLNKYSGIQQVHAAYGIFSNQVGSWTYNAGLRAEYALYEGQSYVGAGARFSNSYLGLFPSAFVSYKLPGEQTLSLSYTRRTNRPDFGQLMPSVNVSNPQNVSRGNPKLLPEFIHNTELSYSRQMKGGHNLLGSVYYQYTQNVIDYYRTFYADGTRSTQPRNMQSATTYGLEVAGRLQLLPVWDMLASANFFMSRLSTANIDPTMSGSGYGWFGKINSNLRLPGNISLQVNGNYRAPKVVAQGQQLEAWWLDVALRKNLLKDKATLVVNVSDICNTRKFTSVYELPALTQSVYQDRETRIGRVTFTYRFGKADTHGQQSSRRARNGNAAPQSEHNNLKSDG